MKYSLLKNKISGERSIRINDGSGTMIKESENPIEYARLRKLALVNINRGQRDDAMRSIGLVRVKGALGGVYWE